MKSYICERKNAFIQQRVTMERKTNLIEHLFYSLQWTGLNVIYNDCPLGSRFPHISSNGELLTVTRRVSLMEQELLTLPEHLCPPLVFSGVRFVQSLVVCVELLTVTRRVSLVEQELLTLPEHLSSPLCFSGIRVAQVFCCLCTDSYVLFFPFNIFLWVIVLSARSLNYGLWLSPFCIFKPLFHRHSRI